MGWYIVGVIALLAAAGFFFAARSQKGKAAVMAATETYTAELLQQIHQDIVGQLGADALAKQCEIKGVIECETPLIAPLSGTPCVAYNHKVMREYEEEVTETDDEGNRKTETRRGSETVESNDQRVDFRVRDATGSTRVDPVGADIEMKKTGERYEDESAHGQWMQRKRTLGYTKTEHALEVGSQVYVLGIAIDIEGQPAIARPRGDEGRFMISWRSEEELTEAAESGSSNFQTISYVLAGVGVILIILGFIL